MTVHPRPSSSIPRSIRHKSASIPLCVSIPLSLKGERGDGRVRHAPPGGGGNFDGLKESGLQPLGEILVKLIARLAEQQREPP